MAVVTVAAPYEPGPLKPVVLVGENLGVWSQASYLFFKVVHITSIPPSRQTIQDLGAVADGANSVQTEFTVIQAQDGSLIQCRFMPLDKVELEVAQTRASILHTTDTQTARMAYWSLGLDPYASQMTHWVLGSEKNLWLSAYNESGYALSQTRVLAWGYRYVLSALPSVQSLALQKLTQGGDLSPDEIGMLKGGLRATIVAAEGGV